MIINIDTDSQNFSSLQVGDILYFQQTETVSSESGGSYQQTTGDPTFIGSVSDILQDGSIVVNNPISTTVPQGAFLLFTKFANKSNVRGYYMDVTMTNSKAVRAELFGVTANIVESSK
jgi:hypothetical protein